MKKLILIALAAIVVLGAVSFFAVSGSDAPDYKTWSVGSILTVAAIVFLALIIVKKIIFKTVITIILVAAIALGFVIFTDFSSAESYYNSEAIPEKDAIGSVTIEIRCDDIADQTEKSHIPENGAVLEKKEIAIAEGETVYDILVQAARAASLQLENDGTESQPYIAGINYIYASDFGELSGWTYLVNGQTPAVGCGEYILADGDCIEWIYSKDLSEFFK